MNFKKTTDELLVHPTLEDLAGALRVSVQTIRQARADKDSKGYRSPPAGWEAATLRLTKNTIAHYERLARSLRASIEQGE